MGAIGTSNTRLDIRELARHGVLATYVLNLSDADRRLLRAAATELVYPVVFERKTRRLELRRRHHLCASSIYRLEPDCLDRFHDDVEAAVDDLFRHAKDRILNLEGWVATRLNASTIDAYRRRRGRRGAMQRPRLPQWLSASLGHELRLMRLALDILEWVGVDTPPAATLWPFASWAERRVAATGDYEAAYRWVVADLEFVLAAMRQRPKWYADFIERPLGHKSIPLPFMPRDDAGAGAAEAWSVIRERQQEADDARLREAAALAIEEVSARIRLGHDRREAVIEVIHALFGSGNAAEELDRLPGQDCGDDEVVYALMKQPAAIDRIVAVMLDLLAPRDS